MASGGRRAAASPGEKFALPLPELLGLLGGRMVRLDLRVDLIRELGVVGERSVDLLGTQPEDVNRSLLPLGGSDIAAYDALNNLPNVRATDESGAATRRARPEDDERVPAHAQALVDQLLGQCRCRARAGLGLGLEARCDVRLTEADRDGMRHDYIVVETAGAGRRFYRIFCRMVRHEASEAMGRYLPILARWVASLQWSGA